MGLKRRLRPVVDHLAKWSGTLAGFERRMATGLTILMYHRVLPAADCERYPIPSLVMSSDAFRNQLSDLRERFDVVTVTDAVRRLRERDELRRPLLAITFDDGYLDNVEHAAPLLEAAGLRATFFVTIGAIEKCAPLWFDSAALAVARLSPDAINDCLDRNVLPEGVLGWLKRQPAGERERLTARLAETAELDDAALEPFRLMGVEQVRELARRGHEIGCHTLTHPILNVLEDEPLRTEIAESKARVDAILAAVGGSCRGFAYPNGDYDPRALAVLRDAGYQYACTTRSGLNSRAKWVDPPFELKRHDITPSRVADPHFRHDSLSFRAEVCGFREWMR